MISLSEKEIFDCYKKGCGTDFPHKAYQFIMENHGFDTEEDYPYKGAYDQCDINKVRYACITY